MNKRPCKKISVLINCLLFIFASLFIECKKEYSGDVSQTFADNGVYSYLFEIGCQSISGYSRLKDGEKYPFQKSIAGLFGRTHFSKGCQKNLLEEIFPDKSSVIESCGYYIPENDKADWVEALLIRLEEERIAQELSEMEEGIEGPEEEIIIPEEEVIPPTLDEIEAALDKANDARAMTDKTSHLKVSEFDKEVFMPLKSEDGLVTVHSSGRSVQRDFYDKLYRKIKTEIWNIPSYDSAELKTTEIYEYNENEFKPSAKKIIEKDFSENISYTKDGLVESSEKYAIVEKEQYIILRKKYTYNDEGKILTNENVEYKYKEKDRKKDYKQLDYSFTKKYKYSYNEGEIPPDFNYYENNVLKMRNKYSSEKGTYTSQIFFEDNLSVKTYYEKDVRIKDVYFSGNKVSREKVYEKQENEQEVIQ